MSRGEVGNQTPAGYTPLQPGFPTTYREEGLVGKLPPNFPTTYTEEGLVGKLREDVRRLSPLCHSAALARRRRGCPPSCRRCARPWAHTAAAAPPTVHARVVGARERDPGPRAECRALALMRRCQQVLRRVPLHHLRTAARPSRTKRATSGARAEYSNHSGWIQHPMHARDACGLLTTCAPNVSYVLRWIAS